MATLPTGSLQDVRMRQQPDLTWGIDKRTNRIQGRISGLDAVRQAVEILLNTERFRWQIYQPYSGMQWEGLVGQDPGYVASELQRRIREALTMDDRVRGISGFSYSVTGDSLTASLTVNTVYGDTQLDVEVHIA